MFIILVKPKFGVEGLGIIESPISGTDVNSNIGVWMPKDLHGERVFLSGCDGSACSLSLPCGNKRAVSGHSSSGDKYSLNGYGDFSLDGGIHGLGVRDLDPGVMGSGVS